MSGYPRQARQRTIGLITCLLGLLVALWPPGVGRASAAPLLTLEPDRGPCTGQVAAHGRAFPVGRTIILFVRRAVPFSHQGSEGARAVVAADGTFTAQVRIAECGYSPEGVQPALATQAGTQFAISAQTIDGKALGPTLASATFTVVPALPGLPNTGEGGLAPPPRGAESAALLGALALGGASAARRRAVGRHAGQRR